MPRRGSWFAISTSCSIGVRAVADHVSGLAPRHGDQLAVDHQHAVVEAV